MRFTLINSGGAQVFIHAGAIIYSTSDHLMAVPAGTRRLRDVRGGRHADIVKKPWSLRPPARITFDDGEQWLFQPLSWWEERYRCDAGDGSATVDVVLADEGIALSWNRQRFATARTTSPPEANFSDRQWTVDCDDDIDPFWIAALLTALVMSARRA